MISTSTFLRTYNPPIPVHFAGFSSTTFELQRAGWDLSVERDQWKDAMRLALRHEAAGLYALTSHVTLRDMYAMPSDPNWWQKIPPFQVVWCGSNARFQVMPHMGSFNFAPVSGIPEFAQVSYKDIDFRDAIPFRKISMDLTSEIIIDPNSVPELMSMILKLQDPKQMEIREKRRREAFKDKQGQPMEEMRPITNIQAQIVTLVG